MSLGAKVTDHSSWQSDSSCDVAIMLANLLRDPNLIPGLRDARRQACASGELRFLFSRTDPSPWILLDLGQRRTVRRVAVQLAATLDDVTCDTSTHPSMPFEPFAEAHDVKLTTTLEQSNGLWCALH